MKYIRLQKSLEDKMNEFEKLCIQERSLLDGKWKTYSLPSRNKKNNHHQQLNRDASFDSTISVDSNLEVCNDHSIPMAVSSEEVDKMHRSTYRHPAPISTPTVILSYQYFNPAVINNHFSYEYVPNFKKNGSSNQKIRKDVECGNSGVGHGPKHKKSHFCNPCKNGCTGSENGSIEAYEIAVNKNRSLPPSAVMVCV